jgi:hypothetical protein
VYAQDTSNVIKKAVAESLNNVNEIGMNLPLLEDGNMPNVQNVVTHEPHQCDGVAVR